ncbi:unnamed protein product [Phytophthora fragariaefolia]|uniref:Unnamed protein product n=1 Tax=Phytophthora fragariaefolia TaxID=1490495 RepID=A0A9W6X5K3_9STRA|nr:unnamed protein product [Phytophthora fragariaefolia]
MVNHSELGAISAAIHHWTSCLYSTVLGSTPSVLETLLISARDPVLAIHPALSIDDSGYEILRTPEKQELRITGLDDNWTSEPGKTWTWELDWLPPQISTGTSDFVTTTESEERGVLDSVASKLKGIFKKNTGISSKLGSTRINPRVAASVEKIPSVKTLVVAMKSPNVVQKLSKNPGSIKKLAKDPTVVKTAALLEKNNVKITKDTVSKLRVAAANDPPKLSKLDIVDGILGLGIAGAFSLFALCLLAASGYAIASLF